MASTHSLRMQSSQMPRLPTLPNRRWQPQLRVSRASTFATCRKNNGSIWGNIMLLRSKHLGRKESANLSIEPRYPQLAILFCGFRTPFRLPRIFAILVHQHTPAGFSMQQCRLRFGIICLVPVPTCLDNS